MAGHCYQNNLAHTSDEWKFEKLGKIYRFQIYKTQWQEGYLNHSGTCHQQTTFRIIRVYPSICHMSNILCLVYFAVECWRLVCLW